MRNFCLAVLAGAFVSSAAFAVDEIPVIPEKTTPPTLTVEPLNLTPAKPDSPIIRAITARLYVREEGGVILDIVPDFHFVAPKGNVILLHREVVETSTSNTRVNSAAISIPAEAQKKGAVISGGWRCNVTPYYVKMEAYLMDADGVRSNPVRYTIHCNGG